MTTKAFFRLLGKVLSPSRPDEYYNVLKLRFYDKIYKAEVAILKKCKGLPEYVYRTFISSTLCR